MPSTDLPTDAPESVEAEVRRLITDLRDAAKDGRFLADRFAEVLRGTVEEYCAEFEQRADDLLARLKDPR
jgi:hypothetical protein